MIKKKLLFASAFLLFVYSTSNISNVDNLNTVKNVENHNVISTDFTSGSAKGRLDKFVDDVRYGKTGGLVNLPGNRFNIQMETCVNCGSVNSVFGTIDESTLCMRCNEPILVKVETETVYCVNCGEAQPKVFNFNSNFLDDMHNSAPINPDILFDLGLTSGNSDLNGNVVYHKPFLGIGDLIGETYEGFENKCVKCGLPVDVLMDKRICENPGCGAENIVPLDSPLDILCKECGELIYFDLCVNCGARNVVDTEICCNPDCNEPVYVLMETRVCENPDCRAKNRVPANLPNNIFCEKCNCYIDSNFYKECVNCHTLNKGNSQFCSNPKCMCWREKYVLKCPSCNRANVMEDNSYFDKPCFSSDCGEKLYYEEKCINCDFKNRIYLDYEGKERVFYQNKDGVFIENGDRCQHCFENCIYSSEFTVIQTNLNYSDISTPEKIYPLVGCAVVLTDGTDNLYFKESSDSNGFVKFKIPTERLNGDDGIGYIGLNIYPTYDTNGKDIRIIDEYGRDYFKHAVWCSESDGYCFKRGVVHNAKIKPICIDHSYVNRSFLIGQAVMKARNFASDMLSPRGIVPPLVNIKYPSDDEYFEEINVGAFYRDSEKTIHLEYGWESSTTIMHEYGHNIQHLLDIIDNPWYKGDHYINENHINRETRNGFLYMSTSLSEDQGMRLAWGEGWATAFREVASAYSEKQLGKKHFSADFEFNDSRGGYKINHSTGNVEPDPNTPDGQLNLSGAGCELTIIEILWDLLDPQEIEFDGFNDEFELGYEEWFDITTREETYTLKDFYDNFKKKYGESETKKLDRLLKHHNIEFNN